MPFFKNMRDDLNEMAREIVSQGLTSELMAALADEHNNQAMTKDEDSDTYADHCLACDGLQSAAAITDLDYGHGKDYLNDPLARRRIAVQNFRDQVKDIKALPANNKVF